MERKTGRSPEKPKKEYWQQKGWKLEHVKEYLVYNGQFKIDHANKQHAVTGSILERILEDRRILTILIKFPPTDLQQSEEINLLPINGAPRKLHEVYELQYKQNPPDNINEAILKTEKLLNQYLPKQL